ncbi:MAG: tyrosine-type recombinase/integrase [Deltaproteobacteria bacterium]|nr:tyrosine-type recombinase/integrase [Deltaproteobacteria bacterium]
MGFKWHSTGFTGVRYKRHSTRKNGVKFDQYYAIYYQLNGKRKEEGIGWASKGWSAKKAFNLLGELQGNQKTGNGPQTLAEKKELEAEKRQEKAAENVRIEKESVTFGQYFNNTYFPITKTNKKETTCRSEAAYFKGWLEPVIGEMPFNTIYPINIEKIKKRMLNKEKSPRTIEYVLAIVRQIWNMAQRDGLVDSGSPTKQVKKPTISNKRQRFLTHKEVGDLFEKLKDRSARAHDVALISLHCGLRASEIFRLTWGSVDMDRGLIHVDGKGDKNRPAFMTGQVKAMLGMYGPGQPNEVVFKDRNGKKINRVPTVFQRTVKDVGFNKGITDRRQKIVFHSLRHTFASWLVEDGTDLYTVQKLLGHASITMTERYSHLSQDKLQGAVRSLEKSIVSKNAEAKSDSKKVVNLEDHTI